MEANVFHPSTLERTSSFFLSWQIEHKVQSVLISLLLTQQHYSIFVPI